MAEAVVSFVVERLGDMLNQEPNFLQDVSGQVEQMQTELKLIQSFLKDADKRQDEDDRVRACVSEIREAAYDAEDIIETFALKVASRRRGEIQNTIKRYACIVSEAVEIHKVGSKIEAIKTKLLNLRTNLQTFGIAPKSEGECSSSAHHREPHLRRSYSHVVEECIVGLDGEVEILVAKLLNEDNHCGLVSIWGMGGLGKTTLAKQVYHHNNIRRCFDAFAWASVSQQFQPRDVWEGILFKLISPSENQRDEIRRLRDEEVAKKLYQVQEEKKCLVILDDIWRTDTWNSLSPAFPVGKGGSKLLLTTRFEEVAQHVDDGRGFLYNPQCLNEEEGWELLKKKAFSGKPDPDVQTKTDMEKLGRKMVGSCAGLPLEIIVLGGVLAMKHTLSEWDMVYENINSFSRSGKDHEQQHSEVSKVLKGHEQQHSKVSKVLTLSYHELPYQLKPCFLHLGHFPENYEIPTKKVVRIWVAEGVVSPMQYEVEGEELLEDLAERYLGELMDRGMVQVGERGSTGRVRTCRLHDLIRDLCLSKANQEIFFKIVHFQDRNKQVDSLSSVEKSTHRVRRLAFYLSEEPLKTFPEQKRTLYLRSLLFFGTHEDVAKNSKKVQSWFSNFNLLKILDLEKYLIAGNIAGTIGNLIHLRYLSLDCSRITNIPSSIGNLRCLQTLILTGGYGIKVPNVIWKLYQLRHLYLPPYMMVSSDKLQLDNLSLQTLQGVDSRTCEVKEIIKLTDLKKLEVTGSSEELEGILSSPNVSLNRLCSLKCKVFSNTVGGTPEVESIISSCQHLYKLCLGFPIANLPEYHHFSPNLTKLSLVGSQLEEDPMRTLGKLPNLSYLRLHDEACIGKQMVCASKGFPQLKYLSLSFLSYVEEWCVSEEAMPSLCNLVIDYFPELKTIPDGLRFITTLQKLHIIHMTVEFENRLRVVHGRGGEDLYKVQHVPSIIFEGGYDRGRR